MRRADPDTGADVVTTAGDPFAGLRKLMKALEDSMGRTEMDRKAVLRQQSTSISDVLQVNESPHCTTYRALIAEMRREGINLCAGELGWFLKDRLGLDALRVQLLDTALQGKEDYDDVEREVLRLFRDLHVADPLNKAKPSGGESRSYTLHPSSTFPSKQQSAWFAKWCALERWLFCQVLPRLRAPTVLGDQVPLQAAAARPMLLKMLKLSLRAMRS